jgi:hypothetical protein
VQISERTKRALLIAAVFTAMAIGKSPAIERHHQAPPPSLAYGGHNFDRSDGDIQSEQRAMSVAFMVSSREKLNRRRQFQFGAAQAAALRSALASEDSACGRGRYRDSINGKCRGPADVSPHP